MRTLLLLLLSLSGLAGAPAAAQLASPGPLSRAHAALEGIRSCTRCHELRQQGIAPEKCLECHTAVRTRIAAGQGYHGRLEERSCARCHQEHIGVAADIVRLDTARFDHAQTGWQLRGAHAHIRCRACHRPEYVAAADVKAYAPSAAFLRETWLGVATECAGCHREDSRHEPGIARRPCSECHRETDWGELRPFDHARTSYPLTGAHREVACAGCHGSGNELRLLGVPHAQCSDCHRDPHTGRYGASCSACHQTAGWDRVAAERVADRFDHARTAFPLRGAHARVPCDACHGRERAHRAGFRILFVAGSEGSTFPRPRVRSCGSCHADAHAGQIREAANCDRCHSELRWLPVRFDIARHQRETRFPLEGAHLAVPCRLCHAALPGGGSRFHYADLDCAACHGQQDPHGSMFAGRQCSSCHRGGRFKGIRFDHTGVARDACMSCHRGEDPHAGQFGERSCGECHATGSFRIERFDHGATRMPLTGAHAAVACAACHPRDARGVVRYRPLATECAACHGAKR